MDYDSYLAKKTSEFYNQQIEDEKDATCEDCAFSMTVDEYEGQAETSDMTLLCVREPTVYFVWELHNKSNCKSFKWKD